MWLLCGYRRNEERPRGIKLDDVKRELLLLLLFVVVVVFTVIVVFLLFVIVLC